MPDDYLYLNILKENSIYSPFEIIFNILFDPTIIFFRGVIRNGN